MGSESFSLLQGALAFQRFGRPAEHVPSAVVSRSAEEYHFKYGWKDDRTTEKEKRIKEKIIITMVVQVAVPRTIMAEEYVEHAE
jgi:hypothetical protein